MTYTNTLNRLPKIAMMIALVMLIASAAGPQIALAADSDTTQAEAVQQDGCSYQWFFGTAAKENPVNTCPTTDVTTGMMAILEFERGWMLWNQIDNSIFVLYRDFQAPYWETYNDGYVEGTPERVASIIGPLGLWQQPRRGFGDIWRNNPEIRSRLGWGLNEWGDAYAGYMQKGTDGSIFITRPDLKVIQLIPGGTWEVFTFLG